MSDWSHQEEQDYTKKLDLGLFKKLFLHMRRHWRNMGFIALSMAVLAITDVFLPLMTRHAIDNYVTPGLPASAMWPFALTYLAIIAAITAVFFFILLAGRVGSASPTTCGKKASASCRSYPSPTTTGCRWAT